MLSVTIYVFLCFFCLVSIFCHFPDLFPQFPPAWSSAPLPSPVSTYPQLHSLTNHSPLYLNSRFSSLFVRSLLFSTHGFPCQFLFPLMWSVTVRFCSSLGFVFLKSGLTYSFQSSYSFCCWNSAMQHKCGVITEHTCNLTLIRITSITIITYNSFWHLIYFVLCVTVIIHSLPLWHLTSFCLHICICMHEPTHCKVHRRPETFPKHPVVLFVHWNDACWQHEDRACCFE